MSSLSLRSLAPASKVGYPRVFDDPLFYVVAVLTRNLRRFPVL
jgi:hypothetical protein